MRQVVGQLRYEVFVDRLHWVAGDPITRTEFDDLDRYAIHIGTFNQAGELVGYVRLIRGGAPCGMLLQKPAFSRLIPFDLDTSPHTAEISRLCVRIAAVASEQLDALLVTMYRSIYALVVVPSRLELTSVDKLYATANNRRAGYMNAERLWSIGFTTIAGPVQLSRTDINTFLLQLDLRIALNNTQFREMLGV